MKFAFKARSLVPLCFLPGVLAAQPMMEHLVVVGAGSYGKDCYEASTVALQFGVGDRDGVEACSRALEYGELTTSYRLAVLVNRGIIEAAMGEFERAAEDYQRAEAIDATVPEISLNRGNLLFSTARYADAVTAYGRALELGMSDPQIGYLNRGFAHERLGQFDQALADYRRALEIAPDWTLAQQKLQALQQRLRDQST